MNNKQTKPDAAVETPHPIAGASDKQPPAVPQEINAPKGPEPTRFGDWERKGRCIDF